MNILVVDDQSNIFYIQALNRWMNDDNRQNTMQYIDIIINKTFESMDYIYDGCNKKNEILKVEFEEDNESLLLRLSKQLQNFTSRRNSW